MQMPVSRRRFLTRPGLRLAFLLVVVLTVSAWPRGGRAADVEQSIATPWQPPVPEGIQSVVTRIVAQMMPRFHYEHTPLDGKLSVRLYEDYFSRLDRDRCFFLASDLAELGRFRDTLDGEVRQGKLDFAFTVYARFVQRVRERVEFTRNCVKQPVDFTKDEAIVIDRTKEPWCKTPAELDELWRLRIKNQLLSYALMDEQQKADEAKKAQEKKERKEPEATVKKDSEVTVPLRPPVERVQLFYERYLLALQENDATDILEIFLSTLTQEYDPHSAYMAPASQDEFDIQMKLALQGIGAVLTSDDGYVKIVEIVPGGPAELDGKLQEGDRIIAVAQEGKEKEPVDVINMAINKVVRLIRGAKGTKVFLTVLAAEKGLSGAPKTIQLVRDEVKLTEQEAKSELRDLPPGVADQPASKGPVQPGKIAVISLPSFYSDFEGRRAGNKDFKSASRDVKKLLVEAKAQHAAGVILDLRSDGGGSLDEAISLTGLFIPKGPVVQVRSAERDVKVQADEDPAIEYDGPLLVMVNRLSASASEIVAAALQDYHRAVIVGDVATHGKGTVQTVYHLDTFLRNSTVFKGKAPGSLKFTVAKFYRITGGSTQQRGVTPDVTFPAYTDFMELGETNLPNSLGWDEIAALDITPVADVRPYLDALKKQSQERVAKDPDFQNWLKNVRHYGDLKEVKTLPLNLEKRKALQAEEERFAKEIRQTAAGRNRKHAKKDDSGGPPPRDLVLDESVRILADLISLENKATPSPVVATGTTPTPPEVK